VTLRTSVGVKPAQELQARAVPDETSLPELLTELHETEGGFGEPEGGIN
jgi:hypothetical protein